MMRAKFKITEVEKQSETCEVLKMSAVTEKPFDADGNSEDNSFAKYTPNGSLSITITNPSLLGKFEQGEKYYLDFTKAE